MRLSAITVALGTAVLVLGGFCGGALAQDKDKVIAAYDPSGSGDKGEA